MRHLEQEGTIIEVQYGDTSRALMPPTDAVVAVVHRDPHRLLPTT